MSGYLNMAEIDEDAEKILDEEIDEVFNQMHSFTYDTSYIAKDVIKKAKKYGITPNDFLNAISGWVDEFEKKKEGKQNEN